MNGEPRALTLTPELAALLGKELKRVHAVQRRAAQGVKKTARGSATPEHFEIAIYFRCGGLDLYPHETR